MIINYFLQTEELFNNLKKDFDRKAASIELLENFTQDCTQIVETYLKQWIDVHPFTIDPETEPLYKIFFGKMADEHAKMLQKHPKIVNLLKPLIEYSDLFHSHYMQKMEEQNKSKYFMIAARIECNVNRYRLLLHWCWRILEGNA